MHNFFSVVWSIKIWYVGVLEDGEENGEIEILKMAAIFKMISKYASYRLKVEGGLTHQRNLMWMKLEDMYNTILIMKTFEFALFS